MLAGSCTSAYSRRVPPQGQRVASWRKLRASSSARERRRDRPGRLEVASCCGAVVSCVGSGAAAVGAGAARRYGCGWWGHDARAPLRVRREDSRVDHGAAPRRRERGAQSPEQRERVEVDGDSAVRERPLQLEAHELVGQDAQALGRQRWAQHVADEPLARGLVVGVRAGGGVKGGRLSDGSDARSAVRTRAGDKSERSDDASLARQRRESRRR